MPHGRKRHVLPLLLKKLTFNPVVAIQGARQTGKSFLARDLLGELKSDLAYISFDDYGLQSMKPKNRLEFLIRSN
jgi:predicted AAA+ superfamily ATPase